jgi:murein DD-endopeptidase MepM/ murein hydrolase activator NlpD
MKNLIVLILLIFTASSLFSQDLDNKKKQLEELKEEIQKQSDIIEQKEKEKIKTIGSLQTAQKKKKDVDNKILKLNTSEKEAKQKLTETISRIDNANAALVNLYLLCEEEYKDLFQLHYTNNAAIDTEIEKQFLADLLSYTIDEIYSVQQAKNSLELDKQDKKVKYDNVIVDKKQTQKQKKQYETEIVYIKDDISRLESEKAALLEMKQQLEQEAAALDELIVRLQADLTADYFSYEFSEEKLNWPVQGKIIRNFGEQKSDKYKVTLQNNGIDIAVQEGTPVHSIDAGVVAFAEWYRGSGKLVIINHQNGYYSLYSHNSNLLVSKGDRVEKDQEIAFSGKTGTTDEACLHFEIRKHGDPVDPLDFLK